LGAWALAKAGRAKAATAIKIVCFIAPLEDPVLHIPCPMPEKGRGRVASIEATESYTRRSTPP
jgi:hypothetical protein